MGILSCQFLFSCWFSTQIKLDNNTDGVLSVFHMSVWRRVLCVSTFAIASRAKDTGIFAPHSVFFLGSTLRVFNAIEAFLVAAA